MHLRVSKRFSHLQEVSRRSSEDLKDLVVAGILAELEEHSAKQFKYLVGRDI
jgi:molybdopterin converting factor small subunit